MGMLVISRLSVSEGVADLGQGGQHVADRHVLAVPLRIRVSDCLAHGRCHSLPPSWSNCAASGGPHVPAVYVPRGGRPLRQDSSIGSMSALAASTSSARVNSVGSPIMQSTRSRS